MELPRQRRQNQNVQIDLNEWNQLGGSWEDGEGGEMDGDLLDDFDVFGHLLRWGESGHRVDDFAVEHVAVHGSE